MTQKIKKILNRITKRHKHTIPLEKQATSADRIQQKITKLKDHREMINEASPSPKKSATTSYPVQKDMILFETLNNIHALFSLPQKN